MSDTQEPTATHDFLSGGKLVILGNGSAQCLAVEGVWTHHVK